MAWRCDGKGTYRRCPMPPEDRNGDSIDIIVIGFIDNGKAICAGDLHGLAQLIRGGRGQRGECGKRTQGGAAGQKMASFHCETSVSDTWLTTAA